ncbi:MAG: MucB/RseB C-terminal domain-containing protein [Candidatus Thiosymbion ectosymbiont of Robbea hypermnestra]|nr:MucB/RseB C-terminal domain-containing protein [Candidatus Thiosymbion ectosymbiont of Robbea hypermnestra]
MTDVARTPSPGSTRFPVRDMTFRLSPLLFTLVWCAQAFAANPGPAERLARMAAALRSLSYEGTVVYLHGNQLESLRVVHRVEDGQVRERMISLNGPVRTLTRGKGGVTCALSGSRPISVPGQGIGREMFHAVALDPEALGDHYGIHPLGAARVAGRDTEVVGVIPRDRLRYGYRFYLDREHGLPLKSDLMGQRADPLEQIMFISLDLLPAGESPSSAGPATRPPRSFGSARPAPDFLPWRFVSLPPGFVLVMHDDWRDTGGQPVDHFVLSDGLASVSVYVETNPREGLEGGTRIGAVHAVGKRVSGHQITVVGEVPPETVGMVLAGIRPGPGERR